jgi:acetolactate synthase-1/3 small subunit
LSLAACAGGAKPKPGHGAPAGRGTFQPPPRKAIVVGERGRYHEVVQTHGILPKSMTPMRHIIAVLLQNEAGALARVAGLFSTRGYNIESLSVAPTDDPTVSRLTLVTKGSDAVIQQIANQLNKLVDVVNVEDMTLGEHLERELVLLKLKVRPERTDTVRGHVVRLGGRVLDPAQEGFIVELTGSEAEVNTFISELARDAELLEVVRSGALGIARSARPLRVVR